MSMNGITNLSTDQLDPFIISNEESGVSKEPKNKAPKEDHYSFETLSSGSTASAIELEPTGDEGLETINTVAARFIPKKPERFSSKRTSAPAPYELTPFMNTASYRLSAPPFLNGFTPEFANTNRACDGSQHTTIIFFQESVSASTSIDELKKHESEALKKKKSQAVKKKRADAKSKKSKELADQALHVTDAMVEEWNAQVGNLRNDEEYDKLLNKFMQLAGMVPSTFHPNIPLARIGFLKLAGYKNTKPDKKMAALECLLILLKNDSYTQESANRLIELAIGLLTLLSRFDIQQMTTKAVIKFAEIYKVLGETIHIHSGKKHFPLITKETKQELMDAANSLEALNNGNRKVEFYTACAGEWYHRLKDDTQELYVACQRIYKLITSAGVVYFNQPEEGLQRFEDALKITDTHLPNLPGNWYNGLIVIKQLAFDIRNPDANNLDALHNPIPRITLGGSDSVIQNINMDSDSYKKGKAERRVAKLKPIFDEHEKIHPASDMIRLLSFIKHTHKKTDWKFSMAAIEELLRIVLDPKTTLQTKLIALRGMTFNGNDKKKDITLPGLSHFIGCKTLHRDIALFKPLSHFEKPHWVNTNSIIRGSGMEAILEIIKHSKEPEIIKETIKIFKKRANSTDIKDSEKDPVICSMIRKLKPEIDKIDLTTLTAPRKKPSTKLIFPKS